MFNADDAVDPVGAIVEAVNAQNSVLSASGSGPLGISYPGEIFNLEGHSPTEHDNNLFTLDENGTLRTSTTFDYESNASSYSIRVETRDVHNANLEKQLTIILVNIYTPIVQSKDHQKIGESTYKIWGEVLNDGGVSLSELGIEISKNLSFSEVRKTSAYPTPVTNEFSVNINSLDAEMHYYYRAYAVNSEGINYGSIRVLNTHNSENFWWKNLTEQAGAGVLPSGLAASVLMNTIGFSTLKWDGVMYIPMALTVFGSGMRTLAGSGPRKLFGPTCIAIPNRDGCIF